MSISPDFDLLQAGRTLRPDLEDGLADRGCAAPVVRIGGQDQLAVARPVVRAGQHEGAGAGGIDAEVEAVLLDGRRTRDAEDRDRQIGEERRVGCREGKGDGGVVDLGDLVDQIGQEPGHVRHLRRVELAARRALLDRVVPGDRRRRR